MGGPRQAPPTTPPGPQPSPPKNSAENPALAPSATPHLPSQFPLWVTGGGVRVDTAALYQAAAMLNWAAQELQTALHQTRAAVAFGNLAGNPSPAYSPNGFLAPGGPLPTAGRSNGVTPNPHPVQLDLGAELSTLAHVTHATEQLSQQLSQAAHVYCLAEQRSQGLFATLFPNGNPGPGLAATGTGPHFAWPAHAPEPQLVGAFTHVSQYFGWQKHPHLPGVINLAAPIMFKQHPGLESVTLHHQITAIAAYFAHTGLNPSQPFYYRGQLYDPAQHNDLQNGTAALAAYLQATNPDPYWNRPVIAVGQNERILAITDLGDPNLQPAQPLLAMSPVLLATLAARVPSWLDGQRADPGASTGPAAYPAFARGWARQAQVNASHGTGQGYGNVGNPALTRPLTPAELYLAGNPLRLNSPLGGGQVTGDNPGNVPGPGSQNRLAPQRPSTTIFVANGGAISQPAAAPRDVAGLIKSLAELESTQKSGNIGIYERTLPGGTRSWTVSIRGTQTWSSGGPIPQDLLSNLELSAGLPNAQERAVTMSMHAAGIKPGEPVELVGHSQGGIVAKRLASDPVFTRRFDVRSVLTAGSPVSDIPVPAHIQVLQLASTSDPVPFLEQASTCAAPTNSTTPAAPANRPANQPANPAAAPAVGPANAATPAPASNQRAGQPAAPTCNRRNEITVYADTHQFATGIDAHDRQVYTAVAKQLPNLPDARLRAWEENRATYIQPGQELSARAYVFESVRLPRLTTN